MDAKVRALAVGVASYLPGLRNLTARRTGGTSSARYCYAVWLRHLVHLRENGLPTCFGTVAELGPGDTLGIGLAALLSRSERYLALDVIHYAEPAQNLMILDALVELFGQRAPIPDEREFPLVQPTLADYRFPDDIVTEEDVGRLQSPERLAALRAALSDPPAYDRADSPLCYLAPYKSSDLTTGSVDLAISHSVLQYAPDLEASYTEIYRWLRSGGTMSHEIDFKSIGRTRAWNGHWTCSDPMWRLMQGRRRNPLNRAPLSSHVHEQRMAGFDVVSQHRTVRRSEVARSSLAPRFANMSESDLTTASALIQSRKLTH